MEPSHDKRFTLLHASGAHPIRVCHRCYAHAAGQPVQTEKELGFSASGAVGESVQREIFNNMMFNMGHGAPGGDESDESVPTVYFPRRISMVLVGKAPRCSSRSFCAIINEPAQSLL